MRRRVRIRSLLFAFAALFGATNAHATDIQWIDATGGDFNDPSNWSPAQVPGAKDRAIVTLAGTYTVTVTPIDQLYIGDLVVGGPGSTPTLHLAAAGLLSLEGSFEIAA